jgi:predicted  nucleic acid-binding Zn-ribbon protein
VSWAGEVYAAIRKIVLLEDRVENLTAQVKALADSYAELGRRLIRLEAKFELIEHVGGAARRALPEPEQE